MGENGNENDQAREDLNLLLSSLEAEISVLPGVKIDRGQEKGMETTEFRVERPGNYDETPEVYTLRKGVPTNIRRPTITVLTHTWRDHRKGFDVENYTHQIIFTTKPNVLGGRPETTIAKTENSMKGTKTIYADTNTPNSRYGPLDKPLDVAKEMLAQLKSFGSMSAASPNVGR